MHPDGMAEMEPKERVESDVETIPDAAQHVDTLFNVLSTLTTFFSAY
jgi:hypothetical protein